MSDLPSLDLSVTCESGKTHLSFLDVKLREAWAALDQAPATLSVAVVGDATMADLHERFLNIAGPTDVLTFELDHGADGSVTEGEVVIDFDEAARRAAELGHRVDFELLLYALHGLLHLCGYDDVDPLSHARMHAREDEILEAIGVGAVFRRG